MTANNKPSVDTEKLFERIRADLAALIEDQADLAAQLQQEQVQLSLIQVALAELEERVETLRRRKTTVKGSKP